jgi:membrane protein YdbS with pleckstrin-like domain
MSRYTPVWWLTLLTLALMAGNLWLYETDGHWWNLAAALVSATSAVVIAGICRSIDRANASTREILADIDRRRSS